MDIEDFSQDREPRAKALIPFGVFLVFYHCQCLNLFLPFELSG